jgi:hypothetical protein
MFNVCGQIHLETLLSRHKKTILLLITTSLCCSGLHNYFVRDVLPAHHVH